MGLIKLLVLFSLLIPNYSESFSRKKSSPVYVVEASPTPTPIVVDKKGVEFIPVKNYSTTTEKQIILKAAAKLDETIKSDCFAGFIKNRKMIQTKGKSSEEVLQDILSLSGDVPVVMYYRRFGTAIAYREPPSKTINLNRRVFTQDTPLCDWASTMGHESLGHSLGNYDHSYKWTKERIYSVPYSIGEAIDHCCLKN